MLDVLTLNNIKYTIYLHTYNVTVLNNPRSNEVDLTTDPNVYVLLHPDKAVMDEPFDWRRNQPLLARLLRNGDPWGQGEPHSSLRNLYTQLLSLERVTRMWQSDETIDAAIYLRSDVWFFNPLNISDLRRAVAETGPAVWTPKFHLYNGLNDRFAFGNREGMRLYGSRRRLAEAYVRDHTLHAESFLKYAMERGNVSTHQTDIVFTRVRSNGYVWELPNYDDGRLTGDVHYVGNTKLVPDDIGTFHLKVVERRPK
eukprot:EG_transcript_10438